MRFDRRHSAPPVLWAESDVRQSQFSCSPPSGLHSQAFEQGNLFGIQQPHHDNHDGIDEHPSPNHQP